MEDLVMAVLQSKSPAKKEGWSKRHETQSQRLKEAQAQVLYGVKMSLVKIQFVSNRPN